jgi:hypothetical protein
VTPVSKGPATFHPSQAAKGWTCCTGGHCGGRRSGHHDSRPLGIPLLTEESNWLGRILRKPTQGLGLLLTAQPFGTGEVAWVIPGILGPWLLDGVTPVRVFRDVSAITVFLSNEDEDFQPSARTRAHVGDDLFDQGREGRRNRIASCSAGSVLNALNTTFVGEADRAQTSDFAAPSTRRSRRLPGVA